MQQPKKKGVVLGALEELVMLAVQKSPETSAEEVYESVTEAGLETYPTSVYKALISLSEKGLVNRTSSRGKHGRPIIVHTVTSKGIKSIEEVAKRRAAFTNN